MWGKPRGVTWLFVFALLLGTAAWVVEAQNAKKVDDNDLRDAAKSKEDWVSYNRDWSETRFSPLDQINATNVSKLGLAWSYDIPNVGDGNRQEATPLIANGVLYSITPRSLVYAIDIRTGKEKWRSDPNSPGTNACCGVVNRGIALYDGKVIAPVLDGRLRALDMNDGKVIWETRVTPTNLPYTLTMAPRVIKGGRVIIGASGGEYSVRGFFSAFDAKTGKELWKFYTVPGDPSKAFEQPIHGEWAKTWDASKKWWVAGGGGPVWGSIAYDPDNDLVYVGTGQPGPWTSITRGDGDNLCTNCILAVKGETGKYAWHYQTTPGDDWDYDSIADITLADLTINGRQRKVLMHAPKNGFFFVIDRVTGEFISAQPWVSVNWASGIDEKGRAIVNPAARYGAGAVNVTPGPGGGHVWPPQSFNPTTGLVYIPSTIGTGYNFQGDPNFVITSAEITEGGSGRMQMGTATGGRGGGRGGGAGRGAPAPGGAAPGLAPGLDPQAVVAPPAPGANAAPAAAPAAPAPGAGAVAQGAGGGAGRGADGAQGGRAGRGGGGGGGGAAPNPGLPMIGPTGRGNILVAWNPVTQKEAWRGPANSSSGFNAGGTVTTAGNLVFTNVANRLLAFKADTGEQVLDLATGLAASPGPPMTFMLDGKQYVAIAGAIGGGGGGGRGGGGGGRGGGAAAPAGPQAPASRLLVLVLDGKPVVTPVATPPAQ